jgi:hypothetical protein
MNLDDAIKNSLTKTQMEGAMQGVMSSLGPNFELHAVPQNAKSAEQVMSKKIGVMNHSPVPRAVLSTTPNSAIAPKTTPFTSPKGMQLTKQTGISGINPLLRRTF